MNAKKMLSEIFYGGNEFVLNIQSIFFSEENMGVTRSEL